ncbi:hypothetical protein Tsubulata_013637 [Turnera subulata]|uniref:E2F/DP family winged-helix DNA-binding domain-containing protein n=1 Tax=Turnera subulata TaxID=218843 RepID=A0A9Q0F908_9ROSI|nr:hypothetical protein Tsubulata_013637 [Turnera subulata]
MSILEESGRQPLYCRKEKSLGVLCTNFLNLYDKDGITSVGLDDAASKLGVERRRIYDVVNILESVGVVARKQKNQYFWKGYDAIPKALEALKEEGLKENFCASSVCTSSKVSDEKENGVASDEKENGVANDVRTEGQENSSARSKAENKREKSLWLLTKNFVKLFLCSDMELITLDSAAMALLGDSHNLTTMRTKVRRLYDIANVFSSMNLIEKTHHPESRRPAFRWLATTGTTLNLKEPKKRSFGTDITNYAFKRNRMESSVSGMSTVSDNIMRCQNQENDGNKLKQNMQHTSKNFVFGPFTPVNRSVTDDSGNKSLNRIQEVQSLATTCYPRYHNEAVSDLFGHYQEAWKSWYVEVAAKEKIRKVL